MKKIKWNFGAELSITSKQILRNSSTTETGLISKPILLEIKLNLPHNLPLLQFCEY